MNASTEATVPSAWATSAGQCTPPRRQYRPPESVRCNSPGTYRWRRRSQSTRKMAIQGPIQAITAATKSLRRLLNPAEKTA